MCTFDHNQSRIRDEARAARTKDADALRSILAVFPGEVVFLEGPLRLARFGGVNRGLGNRRAAATLTFLGELGIEASQLEHVSYGKEKPQCIASTEACWQKNRSVHFAGKPKLSTHIRRPENRSGQRCWRRMTTETLRGPATSRIPDSRLLSCGEGFSWMALHT